MASIAPKRIKPKERAKEMAKLSRKGEEEARRTVALHHADFFFLNVSLS